MLNFNFDQIKDASRLRYYEQGLRACKGHIDYNLLFEISERGKLRMYPWEIEILYKAVMDRKPRTILEIGSWDGCSTMAMGIACKEFGGHIYSVDPRVGTMLNDNIKYYGLEKIVTPIKAFSPWVKGIPKRIEFLFIDGDHSTRNVLMDYFYWVHYMKKNDIVAFHDIAFDTVRKALDIIMAHDGKHWKELVKCEERRRGIGVWRAF